MTPEVATRIAAWTYPGVYAFYNFTQDAETMRELLDGSYFACFDEAGALTGFFCFGASARILAEETDVYAQDMLDVGLGMRPNLCGKGGGAAFVKEGLAFAYATFGAAHVRLTVAAFNLRAIRAYEKAGFAVARGIVQRGTGTAFWVMTKEA